MADTGDTSPSQRRRSSFAGQTFADLFGTGRNRASNASSDNSNNVNNSTAPTGQMPGPITTAAAHARRMSLSTLGTSGSPTQPSGVRRHDSISSANSGSIDESAIEDDTKTVAESQPQSPFARRVSFGARALRDVKSGGGGSPAAPDKPNGRSASIASTGVLHSAPPVNEGGKKTTPPNVKVRADGYNWADSFRSRAERSASITSIGTSPGQHVRAKSIATAAPPAAPPAPKYNTPDHFQERILKGDFYMD